jgi:predicted TIM-barrel fold metal-dependent hydrolase
MSDTPFRFVDAHVHFYDMHHPTLHYAHWQPDEDHPVLGAQTRKLGQRNYLAEDFLHDSRQHGTVKSVHVQAAIGSKDPVDETEWLQAAHARTGAPDAIVGYVDLGAPNAQTEIERHLQYPGFKGIRDFSQGDYLVSDDYRRGFAHLGKHGLVASIAAPWQDMEKVADLAKAHPDTTLLLDHTGLPMARTDAYFQDWRRGMAFAAEAENVFCKISGLGMFDNQWTAASIRPYVEASIELFGTARSLFATNWPIDSLWSDYGSVVDAYREITAAYSAAETEALFAANSERLYGI